jgi:integrase
MPRLVHRLPKYSLHKASGQARVRYADKVTYLGKHGSQESHEAYAEFIASLPRPGAQPKLAPPVPGMAPLVGEIVARYQDHADRYYARDGVPTSEPMVIRSALQPLIDRFRALPVTDLGPKKLKGVREDMIGLGWTRYTINRAVSIVKRCFTWAASEELIPAEVAGALKTVVGLQKNRTAAREKPPIGPVADEHVQAILAHVSTLVGDTVRLMRLTGMRPGEVLAMTADEIDWTDQSCWVYRPGRHKTQHHDKSRTVMIGAQGQEIILRRLMKTARGDRIFPMACDSLRQAVHRGCRRAGVPLWGPNQLRHSFATEVRAKHGLEAAQVLLGHSKADITQTYALRDTAKAADVVRKIG